MKFNLALKNITDVQAFIGTCNKLKTTFSEKTSDGIIAFACAVATLEAKPSERVQKFTSTVDKVLKLIDEVKAQYIEEGEDVSDWGLEICYDQDKDYRWEQIRRGNNIVDGIVVFLCEDSSEVFDWTR
ncbi:MAG: hypothetical protein IJU03_10265 [Thermoguttaceae bacterium]|nr:hypothetical protein [Thermoguttaceae bacterium]